MRNFLLISSVAALIVISTVSAVSDCAVAPAPAGKTAWCTDCYQKTYSELVCSTCNSQHVNAEKTKCVDQNCPTPPATYTTEWCNSCDLTKKEAATDGKSCVVATDCKTKPAASAQTQWCTSCSSKNFTELVCSVCSNSHANFDSTRCVNQNCSVNPATYTTSWCSVCQKDNQTAAADGKSCVKIDCSVKPTNNFSDNWCNACSSPPTKALSDKSACNKSLSDSANTSSNIISFVMASFFVLVAFL